MSKVSAKLTPHRVAKLKEEDPEKYDFLPDSGLEAEIDYPFGEDLEDMKEIFGEKIVMTMAEGHMLFGMQSKIRDLLATGVAPGDVQENFYDPETGEYEWKPSERRQRKSEIDKIKDRIGKIKESGSAEDKEKARNEIEALLAEMENEEDF